MKYYWLEKKYGKKKEEKEKKGEEERVSLVILSSKVLDDIKRVFDQYRTLAELVREREEKGERIPVSAKINIRDIDKIIVELYKSRLGWEY